MTALYDPMSSSSSEDVSLVNSSFFDDRESCIFLAANEGNIELLSAYIQSEPSLLTTCDKNGQTVLSIASGAGQFEIVRYLSELGSDVNMADKYGATPLYRAACGNHATVVKYLLLERGADVDKACLNGFTPLIIASIAGHLDLIKFFHQCGVNMEKTENNGLYPYIAACASGDIDVVRYFTEHARCDIERTDATGCTPLIIAAGAGHLQVVSYLHDSGAQINSRSHSGFSALFAACSSGNMSVVQYLFEVAGADIELKSIKGSTPLYIATVNGHMEVVQYLHSVGADVEAVDYKGLSPLHAAVGAGRSSLKVVAYLVFCGCDIMRQDSYGRTPLDYARRDPLHTLISIIASLWHETPFHKACYENDCDALRLLLDEVGSVSVTSFFSVDCRGRNAWTPLHVAAFFNRIECAELLLEAGANTNLVDFKYQQTALHIACSRGNHEIVKLIVRYANSWRCRDKRKRGGKAI